MAQVIASGKKIEFVTNIVQETQKIMSTISDGTNQLRLISEEINQSTFVKTYNAVNDGIKVFNEVISEISSALVNSSEQWGSVPGLAPKAKASFEEAGALAKKLTSSLIETKIMELPDDLHENVTDELVRKYTEVLSDVMQAPKAYIGKVAGIVGDTTTADTKDLYQDIGTGVEKVTNAFIRAYNTNATELKKWNVTLEGLQQDNKAKTAAKMSSVEAASAKISQVAEADIL